jgi:protein TonB
MSNLLYCIQYLKHIALCVLLPFIFLLLTFKEAGAHQIDTIWYDKQMKEATLVNERYYYKVITSNTDKTSFLVTIHYPNGQIALTGTYASLKPEIKNGEFTAYNEKGIITMRESYTKNIVSEIYHYKEGKQTTHIINKNNPPLNVPQDTAAKYMDLHPELKIITQPVKYADGDIALNSFIVKNTIYPKEALKDKIHGTVFVNLKINSDGAVTDIIVIKSVNPLLDNEAKRVAGLIPNKWIAAKTKDGNIESSFTIPFQFK